ncbi:hypothetical protein Tco_0985688 [Tanacetum coccineum]
MTDKRRVFSLEACQEPNQSFMCSIDVKIGNGMSHQLRIAIQISLAIVHSKKMWIADSTLPLHEGHKIDGMSIPREERLCLWGRQSSIKRHINMLTLHGSVLSHCVVLAIEEASIRIRRENDVVDLAEEIIEVTEITSPQSRSGPVPNPLVVDETIRYEAIFVLIETEKSIIAKV